jgi:hypothetical protein
MSPQSSRASLLKRPPGAAMRSTNEKCVLGGGGNRSKIVAIDVKTCAYARQERCGPREAPQPSYALETPGEGWP